VWIQLKCDCRYSDIIYGTIIPSFVFLSFMILYRTVGVVYKAPGASPCLVTLGSLSFPEDGGDSGKDKPFYTYVDYITIQTRSKELVYI